MGGSRGNAPGSVARASVDAPRGAASVAGARGGGGGGASVINITSIYDSVPYLHNAVYSMTKAALNMFTKAAAVELAPHGIRVNCLAPGAIETNINREVIDQIGREKFAKWIPAGRVRRSKKSSGLRCSSRRTRRVT